jgi:hypothetical protein
MHKNDYYHRDVHMDNIMYKRLDKPVNGYYYRWYLVDYGNIWSNKYPVINFDKQFEKSNQNDIIQLINMVIFNVYRRYIVINYCTY